MKSLIRFSSFAGLIFLALPQLVLAQADNSGINAGGTVSQEGQTQGPAGQTDFQTDLFTGRFGYTIPFELAPARHGSTPVVELRYNSANPNGWCGVGWDIDLGYIQRETRFGVPVQWSGGFPVKAYDDTKGFNFSLNKKSSALVKVADSTYRAQIQSDFVQFQLVTSSDQWVVTDKSGNQYFFGSTTNSRMFNPKTGWSSNAVSGTFRWALDKIQTPAGDIANITYTTISNCLYPQVYTYNGHTNSLTNSCSIQFWLTTTNRADATMSLKSGYRVDQTRLLNAISHKVDGQMIWSNRLTYTTSPSTVRSLLNTVTRYGTNLSSSLPPVTFNYSQQSYSFQTPARWTGLYSTNSETRYFVLSSNLVELADMDGDGLPDRIIQGQSTASSYTNWLVQHNNGNGFDPAVNWRVGSQTYSGNYTSNYADWSKVQSTHGRILDIDGDGKPDWVVDPYPSYFGGGASNIMVTNYNHLVVQLNASSNLNSSLFWTNVVDQLFGNDGNGTIGSFRAVEKTAAGSAFVEMIDMNGDGLLDRVMIKRGPPYIYYVVQFNTGTGFGPTNEFGPYASQGQTNDAGVAGGPGWAGLSSGVMRMLDINGDGLPDRVMLVIDTLSTGAAQQQYQTNLIVELNNGYGFEPAIVWPGVDPYYDNICGGGYTQGIVDLGDDYQVAYRDVNGDGLPDRIIACQCSVTGYTGFMVQINTGTSFAPLINWGPTFSQGQTTDTNACGIQTSIATLMDINGDGLPDRVEAVEYPLAASNYFVVELSKGPFPDLLTNVANGLGGVVSATYKLSTQYDNRLSTNSAATPQYLLPFPMYTVSSVSVGDGLSSTNTTTYNYSGGYWNPTLRQFNGFAQTTVADPLNLTNIHWFHQAGGRDNSAFGEYQDSTGALGKEGMEFRVDTIGSNGNPYKLVLNRVGETLLSGGQHFAFVGQTLTLDYPASAGNYRATARQFAYDTNNGNLTNTINWGEVGSVVVSNQTFSDIGSDTVYQLTRFAKLSNANIVDKPATNVLSTDSAGANILREEIDSYDGATGNRLQELDLICPGTYRTTAWTYDNYGNEHQTTDPAGIVTVITYDSSYQTFPAQTTVASTFTTTTQYDPRSGKLLQSTDPAGLVTANSYDPFLRVLETDVSTTPNGSPTEWLTRYGYNLGLAGDLSSNAVFIHRNDGVDTVNGHEVLTYSDGLGRVAQVRQESEVSGFRVTESVYDQRGNVRFVTEPFFSSGTNFTKPSGTLMGLLHGYDPIGQLNQVTASENGSFNASGHYTGATATTGDSGSPIASSSIAYYNGTDPWTMVVTDEASKVHRYSLDAYGRTNQVVEVFSGSALTTTYGYNLAGDLTNVTDNAANQIQYAYNNMGEMVAMADPDMGVWQYQRDVAGRLRAQIDGDGNTVNFDYTDPLGRLVTRQVYDFTDAHVLGVTNVYDSSDDANFTVYAEQLYKTIDSQGYVKNSYDVRGRTLKTARYLSKNGNTYTNQYLYDDLNRVTQMIYPNGGPTVTNIYDTGANLSKVQQVGGSGTVYYSASGFNALDQLTGISFGNGAATANTYYANSHRLQSVVTSKGGNLQSLSYTYDQVSDLLGVTDGVYTGTASASIGGVAYDDLHRLLSLIRNGQTVTFGYSSIGNITTNGENGTAAYGYGTRLPHAVKSANGTNYAYDQNGSMLTRGNQELVYDPENRLVMVVMSNSTVTFGYDAGGTRLWKQGALTNSLQVWIDGNYEEKDGRVLYHISANGREVCTFDSTGTNVFEYYHPDHLHSTAIETDTNGNRIQHYEYSIYGQSRFTESTTAFPVSRRYTSQVLDEETGLYYYGARYYDPQLGRFVQPDTIIPNEFDPQNYDRYAYCLNNPLKYVDSSGHFVFLAPLIYGAVSAGIGYAAIHIYGSSAIARSDIQTAANLDRMVQAHDFANYNDFLVTQGRTVTAGATSEQVQAAQELGKAGAESVMMANTTIVPELKLEFGIIRGEVPKGGTYKLEEPQTGAVKRTGRTKDLKRRQLEHARGEATKDLDFRVDKRTDDYDTQRGQEQVIYDQHPEAKAENGGLNMNQPISPTNPNKEDYMNAAAAEYPQ